MSHVHLDPRWQAKGSSQIAVPIRMNFEGGTLDDNSAQSATIYFGAGGANDNVTVTVTATGEAGNKYNIQPLGTAAGASPTASISGTNITVLLGTTGANNTATAIASVIDALSGVSATASGTGADTMVASDQSTIRNAGEEGTNDQFGRDANEKELFQIQLPKCYIEAKGVPLEDDAIIREELPFKAYVDTDDPGEALEIWLRNDKSAY